MNARRHSRGVRMGTACLLLGMLVGLLWPSVGLAQPAASAAPAATAPAATAPIVVAAGGSDPFVRQGEQGLEGLSVAIFREVASTLGLSYRLERFDAVDDALDAVTEGKVDVAIGPISITNARAERVAFTQPYFQSSLGILTPLDRSSVLGRLAPFFTRAFLVGSATLLLVLLGVGTLFWLAERKRNPDMFPHSPIRGVGSGVWLGIVTMTTVGYGDRVPVTFLGRAIAGVWMLIAMLSVSSLTAGIATALTVSELDSGTITSIDELRNRKVAALAGTVGARFARERGTRLVPVATLEEGARLLQHGEVAALVHDRPILQHYLNEHAEVEAVLLDARYRPQGYGFAVPHGTALERRLDVALPGQLENRSIAAIVERWLGPNVD